MTCEKTAQNQIFQKETLNFGSWLYKNLPLFSLLLLLLKVRKIKLSQTGVLFENDINYFFV